ncbi:PspC domain-containing protein [Evansella cellulosilytica]|uniref:Phage shock protein C, PspC n=1 Tax=Evansella cellulosilytica (strain ATCC 21833 / DSM 2522 / FERM P-1141 / JCM 9156 / N-4) TaxID=649639 RepID=E6TRI7_EVAC2|nr:PspC domain-containing protein [Evansella cellulosilytica]ADU31817.1 phage shock protein C, PspC [Evansella cellulosilytica DSM 2522]
MKRLYRTVSDRRIAGVCGGIGHYFNIDPTMVRIIALVLMIPFAIFPVVLAYFIATIIIPNETDVI